MLPHTRSNVAAVLLALAALFCASQVHAQTFNLENDRVQMAELHGMWRFHTGDDPDGKLGWADPGFDDSSWQCCALTLPGTSRATRDTVVWRGTGFR